MFHDLHVRSGGTPVARRGSLISTTTRFRPLTHDNVRGAERLVDRTNSQDELLFNNLVWLSVCGGN